MHIRAIWPKLRVRFQRAEYSGEKSINGFVGAPKKNKIRTHLSIVIPTIFQHHVTFRNLSEGKGTVRLNSGQLVALLYLLLYYFTYYFTLLYPNGSGGGGGLDSPCTYKECCTIIEQYKSQNLTKSSLKLGEYAACGFEVLLTRKHEPLVYQVQSHTSCIFLLLSSRLWKQIYVFSWADT